jgi:hypothetical protein
MQFLALISLLFTSLYLATSAESVLSNEVLLAKLAVAEAKVTLGEAKVERAEAALEVARLHLQLVQAGHQVPTTQLKSNAFFAAPATESARVGLTFPEKYTLSVSGICGNYTIHGLWPQTTEVQSSKTFDSNVFATFPDDLKKFMIAYWPNCKNSDHMWFWNHEWTSHGIYYASTNNTPQEYFQAVKDMYLPQVTSGFIQKNCNGNFKYNGPDCRLCYSQGSKGGGFTFLATNSC